MGAGAANPLVTLLARAFLAALFLVAGYNKLSNVAGTVGYMGKLGLPMPEAMAWMTIAAELGGGLLILIGWQTRWVAWGMAAFTVVTMVLGHAFWKHEGQQFTMHLTQFLKNLAIVGGFLLLAIHGAGRFSVDRR